MNTTNENRERPGSSLGLLLSCAFLYIFYIAAKNVYSVEIVEIMRRFDISKSTASLASSASFFTYGVTQFIIAGFLPKINIRKYIIFAVPSAGVLFSLTPFCTQIWQLCILYGITGCLLAAVYPLCIYVVGNYLPENLIPAGNKFLGAGLSVGFLVDYLGCSLLVKYMDWRPAFWIYSGLMVLFAVFFFIALKNRTRIRLSSEQEEETSEPLKDDFEGHRIRDHLGFIIFVSSLGFVSNFLYYAITGWITSILCDVFEVSSSQSIFLTVFVPIVAAIGAVAEVSLTKRFSYRYVLIGFCAASIIPVAVLSFIYGLNLALSLALMALYTALIRGVTAIVVIDLPIKTKKVINTGTLASIVNAVSCIGISIGPPLMGALIDYMGYRAFFITTAFSALILTVMSLLGNKLFKTKE